MQTLNVWFAAHLKWLKLQVCQGPKPQRLIQSRLCIFSKPRGVEKYFQTGLRFQPSTQFSFRLNPKPSYAPRLFRSFPRSLLCSSQNNVSIVHLENAMSTERWVTRSMSDDYRQMWREKPRRVGGVLQPSQRSTNSMCTFPSTCAYFLYSCTAANESWAEAWCCVARCRPVLLFPSSEPEASCARISVTAAAFPLMGSHSSLCVQHSDLCCCGSPASACHFQHGSVWIRVGEIGAEGGVLPLWAHHTAASSLQPRGSVHQCRGGRKGNVSVTMWQGCSDRAVLVHRVDKSQPAQSLLQPWVASHEPPRTASWRPLGRAGWRALLPALLHWLIGILSATKATKFVLFC